MATRTRSASSSNPRMQRSRKTRAGSLRSLTFTLGPLMPDVIRDDRMETEPNVFERLSLTDETCFLCGSHDRITLEHVFPKWLQHRYDLWDRQLTLLNGTRIKYRQLTIPCCRDCNGVHLAAIENQISQAVGCGFAACQSLPDVVIYQWTGKIFFGLLRKELTLLADRKDKNAGTIATEKLVKSFSALHLFLQSVRQPFVFEAPRPYSVLKANLHSNEHTLNYDFRDNLIHQVVQLRLGEVGFIVAFEDRSIIADSYGRYLAQVDGRKLLQIQFDELYAKVLYQKSLIDGSPTYVTASNVDPNVPTTVRELSSGAFVNEWNQEEFANVFRSLLEQNYGSSAQEIEYKATDLVSTWMDTLVDENGTVVATLGKPE